MTEKYREYFDTLEDQLEYLLSLEDKEEDKELTIDEIEALNQERLDREALEDEMLQSRFW